MDKTFEDYISEGKSYFINEKYNLAQNCFVEASKLNPEFVTGKFEKIRKNGQFKRNDYKQECLDSGITYILNDIDCSIINRDLQDMYNPFNRNFNLEQTQLVAILKDYLLLLTRCLNHSSKPKIWAHEYKLMGDIYFKLEKPEIAYNYYKKSLYFNSNSEAKVIFKKLVKKFGKADKLDDKYKLIKNIKFKNVNAPLVKKEKITKSFFKLNGKNVTVEELCKFYYKDLGFDAIIGENHFWGFTADIFFHDLTILRIKHRDNPEIYLNEINKRITEYYNSDASNFVKKYYKINKPTQTEDYIEKIGYQRWFNMLNVMGFEKCLMLTKEILSHNPQILPTSGLPDLIVWNENNFFFVEVKTTNDILSEKQKWWHSYISEELDLSIIIFMVNKNKKQTNKIKKEYLLAGAGDEILTLF